MDRKDLKRRILLEMTMGENEALAREIWRELPSELRTPGSLQIILSKIEKYKQEQKKKVLKE
jgi:hypothetical protein